MYWSIPFKPILPARCKRIERPEHEAALSDHIDLQKPVAGYPIFIGDLFCIIKN